MRPGARLAVTAAAGLAAGLLTRRARPLDLRGRTALITGGSRGLGLEMGRELIAEGLSALAICARDVPALERARRELSGGGVRVLALQGDVTDPQSMAKVVRTALERLGRLDILINNAGVISVGPLATMTLQDFEEAMRTHFWGSLHTTLLAVPAMREQGGGRIANIASIGGKIGVPHLVPYAASKFAQVGLSLGLRAELTRDGILVTTVSPGLMRTGSPRNAHFKGRHRAEYAWFSISDSLPLVSMSASRAAKLIVNALRRGEAEVVLSLPAKVAAVAQALAPEFMARALDLANRVLPRPGGIGTSRRPGRDSESALSPSILTALNDVAARRLNQMTDRPLR